MYATATHTHTHTHAQPGYVSTTKQHVSDEPRNDFYLQSNTKVTYFTKKIKKNGHNEPFKSYK